MVDSSDCLQPMIFNVDDGGDDEDDDLMVMIMMMTLAMVMMMMMRRRRKMMVEDVVVFSSGVQNNFVVLRHLISLSFENAPLSAKNKHKKCHFSCFKKKKKIYTSI